MDVVSINYAIRWYDALLSVLPGVIGAVIILIIGWIAGRLLGKAVRIILDKAMSNKFIAETKVAVHIDKSKITVGYIGDLAVRCIVYLIAILAASDFLQLEYLSKLMSLVITYIPHVIAFIILLVVGFILIDYFIDFMERFYADKNIEFIQPVLMVLRLFLYLIVGILALSQLQLDLTIVYTFLTPIAWGIGLGIGVGIAVVIGFGLKNRSEAIMDQVIGTLLKK
jgi:small-conductance mechanosensitive channel